MTFPEAREYIASFINFEQRLPPRNLSVFKLERLRYLLDLLGNPQNNLKIIHVAGSKGKGSTCAMTASILCKAGYKIGLYTSPHLNDYRERIRVLEPSAVPPVQTNEEDIFPDMISEVELCATLEAMQPHIARLQDKEELGELSFFELFTALAFYYFNDKKVDWVVLETGMGGRLDATNVASTNICAITPISLEHTQYLGDTIAKIAAEKAAIIKDSRQKVIIAPQSSEARDVFEKRCAEFSIHPKWIGQDIRWEILREDLSGQLIRMTDAKEQYMDLSLPLRGRHQAMNAAVVLGIIEALRETGCVVPAQDVVEGFQEALWPGRFEIIQQNPFVVLDCAHNEASAMTLVESLRRIFPEGSVTVILGVSQDKDRVGICKELNRIAGRVIMTKADHPRSYEFTGEELTELFAGKVCLRAANIEQAIESAFLKAVPKEVILITGSVFLVGEARRYLTLKKAHQCHNP